MPRWLYWLFLLSLARLLVIDFGLPRSFEIALGWVALLLCAFTYCLHALRKLG